MGNGAFRDTPEQHQIMTSQLVARFLDPPRFCRYIYTDNGYSHIISLIHDHSSTFINIDIIREEVKAMRFSFGYFRKFSRGRKLVVCSLESFFFAYVWLLVIVACVTWLYVMGTPAYLIGQGAVGNGLPINYVYYVMNARSFGEYNVFVPWALIFDLIFWAALASPFFYYRFKRGLVVTAILFLPLSIYIIVYVDRVLYSPYHIILSPWLVFWP
ncbi:MAG: hypothetical protein JRN02_06135 [Nitrososphaerota archaeon]|nr:hypothetical protein [Nitrososphaerota archaeon]